MLSEVAELFGETAQKQTADRRMSQRLLSAWARAARGHYPSWLQLRAIDLGSDWNWAFVVDLQKSANYPYFVYLGRNLAKLSDVYLAGADDWAMSLLDIATAEINAAVEAAGPHTTDQDVTLCDGRLLRFRSITAPLADDGATISHIFGAASGILTDRPISL